MGRIKKVAGPKHVATLSPALKDFVSQALQIPLAELPAHFKSFPFRWPYPRGDLYHWIPLLNLFDTILDDFIHEYGLHDGPQTQKFGTGLLLRGIKEADETTLSRSYSEEKLRSCGFSAEGDRELVEAILDFSRILLENCGNRSLYASSERLGYLLNTVSVSLLLSNLRLTARLAIRCHHSRQRGSLSSQQLSSALLANHYNINLEHIQRIADTFAPAHIPGPSETLSSSSRSPTKAKGKPADSTDVKTPSFHVKDMLQAVRLDASADWEGSDEWQPDWRDMTFTYHVQPSKSSEDAEVKIESESKPTSDEPSTPTPLRRPSGLSRQVRNAPVQSSPLAEGSVTASQPTQMPSSSTRTVRVTHSSMVSTSLEDLLASNLPDIPKEQHYVFLDQLRTTKYVTESLKARRDMIAVRILALTNLAYVYPETTFQQKLLKPDSDEPRRSQIVQQLAELIHPPDNEKAQIPLYLKTIAVGALEALSKHKSRASDVCSALSVNVSHGVLLFILRKTASDLSSTSPDHDSTEIDYWQEALLSLLDALPSTASRTADSLVGAGLLDILVEVLQLRTEKAERIQHKVLAFLNSLVHGVRDAFQAFVNAKGLEAISDLIAWEVTSSIDLVKEGKGMPDHFKSQVTDYQMSYFQQQTLRWLFKFVNNMMANGGGNFDRLLRNLIDSPPLLGGLREVLANGTIFGSTIWSGAVNILSSFIHNEPTSYAVIAEAGLSKSFLDSISSSPAAASGSRLTNAEGTHRTTVRKTETPGEVSVVTVRNVDAGNQTETSNTFKLLSEPDGNLAQGILPATDAIIAIPAAFGAICLNTGGLDLFLASDALQTFFEIFESPDHVKAMAEESKLPQNLGHHFDELVRHHPRLKPMILQSVLIMCARLSYSCQLRASKDDCGAKLRDPENQESLGESSQHATLSSPSQDGDVSMDNSGSSELVNGNKVSERLPSVSTYIGVAARFLAGFFDNRTFDNHTLCSSFLLGGGLDFLLDLTTSHSLPYNFNNQPESQDLSRVIRQLIDQKPHLTLPSVIMRSLQTLKSLEPLMSQSGDVAFFATYTTSKFQDTEGLKSHVDGTLILKALVGVHTLSNVLQEAFMAVPFTARAHHTLFSQVNLADLYIDLTRSLGRLYRVCVWEEILLQKNLSDELKESTRVRGYGMGSDEADEVFGFIHNRSGTRALHTEDNTEDANVPPTTNTAEEQGSMAAKPMKSPYQENIQALRFLLSQVPSSITPFFQGLGRALVSKRRSEPYQRQNAYMVAEALAETALEHLRFEPPQNCAEMKDRFAYWIVALTSLSQLLIEGPLERPHSQCLTLVLQAFRNLGGIKFVNDLLASFFSKIQDLTSEGSSTAKDPSTTGLLNCLYGGMKLVLSFYGQITSARYITESTQSQTLMTSDRERSNAYYFNPSQFLVELRMSVVSAVQPIWDSSTVDGFSSSILKYIIEILKTVLDADQEQAAFTSSSSVVQRPQPEYRQFTIAVEKENTLKERDLPASLVREALYRCYNNREYAEDYCDGYQRKIGLPRLAIPSYDAEQKSRRQSSEETIPDADDTEDATASSTEDTPSVQEPVTTGQSSTVDVVMRATDMTASPDDHGAPDTDVMADSIDNILNLSEMPRQALGNTPAPVPFQVPSAEELATVEKLDEVRSALRKNFIARILDILSVHDDLTYELSELIVTAAAKAQDAISLRKEIGETLVQSLISFQYKDDFRSEGGRIAAYANLLARVIQEREFYDAALEEIKDNMESLLSFVKMFPDQSSEESSPWIAQVLLVVEKLLSEDVQPEQIKWTPPTAESSASSSPVAELSPALVSSELKAQLFDSILDILPKVNKDQSLALSIVRVLVILTRDRNVADRLGEKKNLQRLFVVAKQLVGRSSDKFQSTFILVLRHIVEDDVSIKKTMRAEIKNCFQNRPSRPLDTTTYVRNMHSLVLRAPQMFLETTNKMVKLEGFDQNARSQPLVLRNHEETVQSRSQEHEEGHTNAPADPEPRTGEDNANVRLTTEQGHTDDTMDKTKTPDAKYPLQKYPDGVVHFLLSQLLSYKDVEDKGTEDDEFGVSNVSNTAATGSPSTPIEAEVEHQNPNELPSQSTSRSDKPEYKAEQHPIYVYRCFLLQCLTELLMSYSKAKVEFLNFSRRSDSKVSTPSKPRSGVLNYILMSLVPIDTLERSETISFRKAVGTSNWAMSTVVALCLGTKELVDSESLGREDAGSELLFIQRFVLENALKAFKDAQASGEPPASKYARLLSVADLFSRLLNGRVTPVLPHYTQEPQPSIIKNIAKIMFEKSFIPALTNAIADIDMNVPNSKRAIKYILRPLKTLTHMAIQLSETSELVTTPSQSDGDEISSATSLSEDGDEREETPDLFRHSTLGMLDPGGRENESSSESGEEDEEMYDDDYDEPLEYEDDIEHDEDEVISDEDEELGDAGPLEGLPGDVDMDVEVVLDGDEDEDATDEDLSDDSDDMDDGDIEIIDEINDDNDSMDDGEAHEWGDDEEVDLDDPYSMDAVTGHGLQLDRDDPRELHDHRDQARELVLDLPAGASIPGTAPAGLEMDLGEGQYMGGLEVDMTRDDDDDDDDDDVDDDDAEEDEDDEDLDDDDIVYPDYDGEDEEVDGQWRFEADDEGNVRGPRGHHHHSHVRRIVSPWSMFTPGHSGTDRVPTFRNHRTNAGMRGADDGVNPLLQRTLNGATPDRRNAPTMDPSGPMSDFMHLLGSRHRHEGVVSLLNGMMTTVGVAPFASSHHGALHLHLDTNGGLIPFPRDLQTLMSASRHTGEPSRGGREESSAVPAFLPRHTAERWSEEARLLFGPNFNDKTQRIINSLLSLLVPPALEEERIRKEKAAEETRKLREQEEKEHQERIAREEEAEKQERERKEREDREAAQTIASETEEQSGGNVEAPGEAMEGVETTGNSQPDLPPTDAEPSPGGDASSSVEQSRRIRAVFRGREVDITHLGIDLEYLDALPEELREEVLMQQLAEQRSQAAVSGDAPTGVDREFLDALPADIREEILQQEAQERRRREREEARRQAATASGAPAAARAEEMDPASFLASLDPSLRHAVLLEQDDEMLSQLPAAIAAEARALGAERLPSRFGDVPHGLRNPPQRATSDLESTGEPGKRPGRKQIVQMLDKAGVATLLRLLLVSQQGSGNDYLKAILQNASRNTQNRAEILSILLSILQDGTSDSSAIERSFTHLSLRAKQTSQKTPQSLKRTLTSTMPPPPASELAPMMAIQQCLGALLHLTEHNPHVPAFFLSEHEQAIGFRNKASKKGKGKDFGESKFAVNTLLSLLDRKLITENASCMEQLVSLMQIVTRPLVIVKREREAAQVSSQDLQVPDADARQDQQTTTQAATETVRDNEATDNQDSPTEHPPENSAAPADTTDEPKESLPKKLKNLPLPIIPDQNYCLVVSILGARECSSKTFRDTLSTINNLSTIPGARDVFGKELVKVSQHLGETITQDLDLLASQINGATSSDDIHGMALAKFSPSSSNQAKFLRVLTALDYLFAPKRSSKAAGSGGEENPNDDLISSLHESSTFEPLWNRLSECLRFMRQRDNMLNTATVLLPLVEALMVVCKNSVLRETDTRPAKEFSVSSPGPETGMKSLFFRFTEEHRKILNDLVRNNPRLMSGTFSLLVKNPKVLEFDNKRSYFTRQLHTRGHEFRHAQTSLNINIQRNWTFIDSFKQLYYKKADEMKYGKLSIKFIGEEGVDAGGVTREWFQTMSRQMFNPDYALFVPVASDRTTFHPNRLSQVNEEHLFYFKFIGRVIGKALYEGRALDCHFSRAVYKKILSRSVSIKDMETLDLEYYKSLLWMLENDISDIITETFSIETEVFGVTEVVDLIPDGRNIPVTEENKQEYVQLVIEYRLTGSVQTQLEEFLKGFHDIVPASLISIFNEQELELLISGLPDIDVDDWKNNTEYHNYSASSAQIQWFWRAVRSFDKEEQAKLLQFVTGTAKVPLNGFKELEGMNGFSRFNIHRDYGNKSRLPSSHTCFNQLDLPEYDDYETLRKQLYMAMTAGSEYFGFA